MRIGINILCYFPWSIFAPCLASVLAKIAGFEMLQVLPFRGIGPGFFPSLSVCYLENVWPGGEIGAYIKGKLLKDSLAPRTPYAILFPDRSRAKIVY